MAMSKNVFDMAAEEKQPFENVLENLSPADHKVVDAIAARVNQRVIAAVGVPPKVPFYKSWGPLLVGAVAVIGVVTIFSWPTDTNTAPEVAAVTPAVTSPEPNRTDVASPVVVDSEPEDVPPSAGAEDVTTEDIVADQGVTAPEVPVTFDGRASDLETETREEPKTAAENPAELTAPGNERPDQTDDPTGSATDSTVESNPDSAAPPLTASEPEEEHLRMAIVQVKLIDKRTYLGVKPPNNGGIIRNGELPSRDAAANRNATMLPQEMPIFPGGDRELEQFLADQVDATLRANPDLVGETVAVNFLVSHKGKISDIRARNGNTEMRAEAERIVALMPNWDAGTKKGKISCMVSITFK